MWDDARQLNAIAATLSLIALGFLAFAVATAVARLPAFEYREIVVTTPLVRASAAHLESIVRSELRGTFFTMNLDAASESLAKVPWVRSVVLRRQWPRRLEIEVDEHAPFARWNDNALVDTHGDVFVANFAGELPEFAGPDGTARHMTAHFREWTKLLAPSGLRLTGLALSARGGWRLRATDDAGPITLDVGRDDTGERLARFLDVYRKTIGVLARTGTHVDHVDLRYRNGFAARVPGFREKPAKRG